jgi:hypothetical protein
MKWFEKTWVTALLLFLALTLGKLLGYESFSKQSKAHLHQTKLPNALPTSWRCSS